MGAFGTALTENEGWLYTEQNVILKLKNTKKLILLKKKKSGVLSFVTFLTRSMLEINSADDFFEMCFLFFPKE